VRGGYRVLRSVAPSAPGPRFEIRSNGFRYQIDPGSHIDWSIAVLGDYEAELKRLFLALVPSDRGRNVLDIGANVGTHSLTFSRRFKRVIAFEPNPEVFEHLTANLALNPQVRVDAFMVGLADVDGEAEFYRPPAGADNQGLGTFDRASATQPHVVERLPIRRGDAFLSEQNIGPIDAIKMDVQGLEASVLTGLREVIEQDRPLIWLEVSEGTLADLARRVEFGSDVRLPFASILQHTTLGHLSAVYRRGSDSGPRVRGRLPAHPRRLAYSFVTARTGNALPVLRP
jgi:FkbM family methyltransferase